MADENTGNEPWFKGVDGADETFTSTAAAKGWDKLDPKAAAVAATRAYNNAQALIGVPQEELVRVPKDANGDWSKVWHRLGKPEKVEGYDFNGVKFKDGTEVDAKFLGQMRDIAYKTNLTKDAAKNVVQGVMDFLEGETSASSAEQGAKLVESQTALAKLWGVPVANLKNSAQMDVAKTAATKLGWTPEIVTALESVVGYDKVIEALRDLGSRMGEDKYIRGGDNNASPTGAMNAEQATSRKQALMSDNAWVQKYNNGDTEARAEMSALNKIIVGSQTGYRGS